MSAISTGGYHGPGQYEIRLKGHLHSRWAISVNHIDPDYPRPPAAEAR